MEKEVELDRLERIEKDKDKQRRFELDKAKLEATIPRRWDGFMKITWILCSVPIYIFLIPFVTILVLCKKEVPEIFNKMV
jgi:hypothetical protein